MLMNPKSIDLKQKQKLKSASRPFNSLGSRFITAAPCFWHGAAERVVASITAAGKEPDYDLWAERRHGTYVVEFRTAAGALAVPIPRTEAGVIQHFQERMPYGLFVPDVP
jgi:hypothetical protein